MVRAEKSGDDPPESQTQSSSKAPSNPPMHIYTFSVNSSPHTVKTKRRQVKHACTKCQKSGKRCDDARPCLRCVKYGYGAEECVDAQRKERKKGMKRGPYKKRDGQGTSTLQAAPFQGELQLPPPAAAAASTSAPMTSPAAHAPASCSGHWFQLA